MSTTLQRLQNWYAANCNGDWEHTYGVKIENIGNPGWLLAIELADTYLQDVSFTEFRVQRQNEDDWVLCHVEKYIFKGVCGPRNLEEMLRVFLDWAEMHDPDKGT